jgi:hypothetical protein
MATTTNYSWTTPDDTALVKDGAAAIRTLGSSVDTTVKNLNPETTLGDIAYRSSTANVKTRLGLGTAGQFLAVNSGANAPEWVTLSAGSFTQLASANLPAASTVTISSIDGSYRDLRLLVRGVNSGAINNTRLIFRLNADTGSNYYTINAYPSTTTSATSISRNFNFNTSATDTVVQLDLFNYIDTTTSKFFYRSDFGTNNSGVITSAFQTGTYKSNSIITSITILDADGNNFAAGNYLLLGIK